MPEIDFDAAQAIVKKMQEEMATLRATADKLQKETEATEASLKGEYAVQNLERVKGVIAAIMKATAEGEERVRELERWLAVNHPDNVLGR